MTRWARLWRPVYRRARSDWPFLVACWLLIASATTLLAAGTLYAETVEIGGLRRALTEAPPADQSVVVRLNASRAEIEALDAPLRDAISSGFAPAGARTSLTARSASLKPIGPSDEPAARRLVVLGSYEALEEHAELTDGRWPEAGHVPFQAALSEGAAEALGLTTGGRLALADASDPRADPNTAVAEVEIVGIYEPRIEDAYWVGDRLELAGVEDNGSIRRRGPVMVARDDLLSTGGSAQLDVRWRAELRLDNLRLDQLAQVRAGISSLPGRVGRVLPAERFMSVSTGLAGVLGGIDRSSLVSRSGVVLITLQFAVLAGYAVLLVGGLLVERRRPEVALLRARGASTLQIAALALGEATLLALPAVIVAPLLALGLVNLLGGWGAVGDAGIISAATVSAPTLIVAVLGGAACVVALTLPALITEIDLARVRAALGRPIAQTLAQRLGIDLVLLLLAAIGLLQLRAYGAPLTQTAGGGLTLDPLLVAAPAIGLAAGAVLVIRLVPRLGELAEWLLRRRRGLILPLGARDLARRPLRYTRSALLIVLAAALGTFAAVYSTTWSRSQQDQAAFQAGADLRVVLPTNASMSVAETGAALRALPGVTVAMPVGREQVDVGRVLRRADLAALDPAAVPQLVDLVRDAQGRDPRAMLAALAEARPDLPGVELPADARRLGIVVDTDLRAIEGWDPPIEDPWPGISIVPTVQYADGSIDSLEPATALFMGADQRIEYALAGAAGEAATGVGSLRLLQVDVTIFTPAITIGDVTLTRIEASTTESTDATWQTAAVVADLEGWSFILDNPGTDHDPSFDGPSIINTPQDPYTPFQEVPPTFRWNRGASAVPTLAVIASDSFLAQAGASVGDALNLELHFHLLQARVVGSVGVFPSLDPATPFVLVDSAALDVVRQALQLPLGAPAEWWLAAEDAQLPDVTEAVRGEPFAASEVTGRRELTQTLERDPIALGLVGALALGSLAAVAFAALGFVVTAVVSAREQLGEVALLRALGLSARQVLAWLSLEHAFLLAVGLISGTSLGLLISVLVLPYATLNRSGAPVVPSPVIVVPWDLLALVGLAALALLVATVALAARQLGGQQIADVLRAREN